MDGEARQWKLGREPGGEEGGETVGWYVKQMKKKVN